MIRLFAKGSRRQSTLQRKNLRALKLTGEQLECRLNLSGDISAIVSSGDLRIRDDGSGIAPAFSIAPGTTNDEVIVSPRDGTTINGQSGPVTLDGITDDWDIRLKNGDNSIIIESDNSSSPLSVPDDLKIRTGRGDDSITVDNIDVGGDVSIQAGSGDDQIEINLLTAAGQAKIRTDSGHDTVLITDLDIAERARVRMSRGDDTFLLNGAVVGELVVQSRSGHDQLDLLNFEVDDRLSVRAGGGTDEVTMIGSRNQVHGEARVRLNSGDDLLTITNTTVDESSRLDGGGDFDVLRVDDPDSILDDADVRKFELIEQNTIGFQENNILFNDIVLTDMSETITVTHVDNVNTGGGGNTGTFEDPNGSLSDVASVNDIVYVHSGTVYSNNGYVLEQDQHLLGEGDNNNHLVQTDQLGTINLPAASGIGDARPVFDNTAGLAIIQAFSGEISNLTLQNAPIAIQAQVGLSEALNVNRTDIAGGETAVNVAGSRGTLDLTGVTITDSTTAAISISGGDGDVFFGGANDSTAGLFGPSTINQSDFGSAVSITNHGSFIDGSFTLAANSIINATNGDGLQFDNADGTYTLDGATTLNGGDAGIDIVNDSGGVFAFGTDTSITDPSGTAFNVADSLGFITFNGSITKSNDFAAVAVTNDGSDIGFASGTITATHGDGLRFNGADGSYSFDDQVTLSGNAAGILIENDSSGAFTFGNTDITDGELRLLRSDPLVRFLADSSIAAIATGVTLTDSFPDLIVDGAVDGIIEVDRGGGTHVFNGPMNLSLIDISGSTGEFTFSSNTSVATSGLPFGLLINDGPDGGTAVTYLGSIEGFGTGIHVTGGNNTDLTVSGSSINMTGADSVGINFSSRRGTLSLNNVAIDMNSDLGTMGIRVENLDNDDPINLSGLGNTVVDVITPTVSVDDGGGFNGTIEVNAGENDLP